MSSTLIFGINKIIISLGAIVFGVLGYRLFVRGASKGKGNLEFSSPLAKVVFSGVGPGLFFMAFGAIILVVAIHKGGVTTRREEEEGEHVPAVDVTDRSRVQPAAAVPPPATPPFSMANPAEARPAATNVPPATTASAASAGPGPVREAEPVRYRKTTLFEAMNSGDELEPGRDYAVQEDTTRPKDVPAPNATRRRKVPAGTKGDPPERIPAATDPDPGERTKSPNPPGSPPIPPPK